MKLLLAEDDPMVGAGVEHGLRLAGFVVDWVKDGKAAELALADGTYAVLLLDLGLPRQDGIEVLKKLRRDDQHIPVLIITARDAVSDRVMGLNLGADDYLIKPFDLDELVARVHALARRKLGRVNTELSLGGLRLNPLTRTVTLDGQGLNLSQREFTLLHALMQAPGTVLSREDLEDRLYGWGDEVASNTVEVHIHHLRRKLGAAWIRNVRGVGYKLMEPPQDTPS